MNDNSPMPVLQTLRSARTLALGVLAWFALSLGVAIASPVVSPQALTLVCSAAGAVKLVSGGDDSLASVAHQTLDCVLCLALDAPVTQAVSAFLAAPAPGQIPSAQGALGAAYRSAAALPARGPPQA